MIEINNFFLKSRRWNITRCGGSGGGDFNTAFHKGWRTARISRPSLSPKKSNNERKENNNETQTYKRASAVARIFAHWLFLRMKSNASHFLTTNKKGNRMKKNFFDIALALRLGAA